MIEVTEKIDLDEQFVMPLHRDLINCKKYKLPTIFNSPYAVFVKKMASTVRNNWTKSMKIEKSLIKEICKEFPNFRFLVNFQYKKGITFNSKELEYIELVQQIPELTHICMYEKDPVQTSKEFSEQLKGFISRNNRKIIVPALEPNSNEIIQKISAMKKRGIVKCALIFRGFEKEEDRANLSKALANLRANDIYSFVFGIFPTKWKKTQVSMLYPSLHFKANSISSWIAWNGRASAMTFLCLDWIFKEVAKADEGLSDYEGKKRKEFLKGKTSIRFNTALSQIDTINQASELSKNLRPLPKVQFEKLFS